jgi:phospholipase C
VRGYLTEGRYLVFESNGYALTNSQGSGNEIEVTEATSSHRSINHRWVLHATTQEGTTFKISSAVDSSYVAQDGSLSDSASDAETYNIVYVGGSQYTLQKGDGTYLNIATDGSLTSGQQAIPYSIYSVTYHS